MSRTILLIFALLGGGVAALAGETAPVEAPKEESASSLLKIDWETEAQYSYVGAAPTEMRHRQTGNVTEQNATLRAIGNAQWGQGPIYRFGLGFQRYSFGLPSNSPLPNTLQSVSLVFGVDFQLGDSWLMRVEVEPGVYTDSDDVRTTDFNAPFIIGGSYIQSAAVQWVFGLSVDTNRKYPIIPALGVRWNIHGQWTINAVLPTPRLEYAWSKALTLYTGAEIKDGTYRVGSEFGDRKGNPKLNGASVEYDEVRVGGGLTWKPISSLTLEVEAGYMPYREFNFHRAEVGMKTKEGAAYGQVGLSAKF